MRVFLASSSCAETHVQSDLQILLASTKQPGTSLDWPLETELNEAFVFYLPGRQAGRAR